MGLAGMSGVIRSADARQMQGTENANSMDSVGGVIYLGEGPPIWPLAAEAQRKAPHCAAAVGVHAEMPGRPRSGEENVVDAYTGENTVSPRWARSSAPFPSILYAMGGYVNCSIARCARALRGRPAARGGHGPSGYAVAARERIAVSAAPLRISASRVGAALKRV